MIHLIQEELLKLSKKEKSLPFWEALLKIGPEAKTEKTNKITEVIPK